jgi:hypothetical protein
VTGAGRWGDFFGLRLGVGDLQSQTAVAVGLAAAAFLFGLRPSGHGLVGRELLLVLNDLGRCRRGVKISGVRRRSSGEEQCADLRLVTVVEDRGGFVAGIDLVDQAAGVASGVDEAVLAGHQRQDVLVGAVVDELRDLARWIEHVNLALGARADVQVADAVGFDGEDVLGVVRLEDRLHRARFVTTESARLAADAASRPATSTAMAKMCSLENRSSCSTDSPSSPRVGAFGTAGRSLSIVTSPSVG